MKNRITPPPFKLGHGDKLLNIAQFIPIIGTGIDAYNLYKDPSWENAAYLGLSLLGDITFMPALKAVKGAVKANKLSKLAAQAKKQKGMNLILKRGMNKKKVWDGFDTLRNARIMDSAADKAFRKALGIYVGTDVIPGIAIDAYQINQAE